MLERTKQRFLTFVLALVAALGAPTVGSAQNLAFPDFSDVSRLDLAHDADSVGGVLRLTSAVRQVGTAFLSCPIAIDSDTSFAVRFRARIHGGEGADGTEGMVFYVQNGSTGPRPSGWRFGPSVGVEMDTYFQTSDPDSNHIALVTNGNSRVHDVWANPGFQINDGVLRNVWVRYDGSTNRLDVFVSEDAAMPEEPLLTRVVDIPAVVGPRIYLGFAASVRGSLNRHDVEDWEIVIVDSPQFDRDGDLAADACDSDDDDDGVPDVDDNCPIVANPLQTDGDGDDRGDACDDDWDGDGTADGIDADDDGDGVPDVDDNCPLVANPDQQDAEGDLVGDACDDDDDDDGVRDRNDNCPFVANADQVDSDEDRFGDECDGDDDNDYVSDGADNCPFARNSNQWDIDADGVGDACDTLAGSPLESLAAGLPGEVVTHVFTVENRGDEALSYLLSTSDAAWATTTEPERLDLRHEEVAEVLVHVTIDAEAPAGRIDTATIRWEGASAGASTFETHTRTAVHRDSAGGWEELPRMPRFATGSVIAISDREIWVAGGRHSFYVTGTTNLDLLARLDAETATWSSSESDELAPMPEPRTNAAGCMLDGKLYVVGGDVPETADTDYDGEPDGHPIPRDSVVAYDVAADEWNELAPASVARTGGLAVCDPTERRLLVFGARLVEGGRIWNVESYEVDSDSWGTHGTLPAPGSWTAAWLVDESTVVLLGPGVAGRYDLVTAGFEEMPPFPSSSGPTVGALVEGEVCATGASASSDWFCLSEEGWIPQRDLLPVAHYGSRGGIVDGHLYLLGGTRPRTWGNGRLYWGTSADVFRWPPVEPPGPDSDTDVDVDTDVDADTDADTDGDTDADAGTVLSLPRAEGAGCCSVAPVARDPEGTLAGLAALVLLASLAPRRRRRRGGRTPWIVLLLLVWTPSRLAYGWETLGPTWRVDRMPVEWMLGPASEELGDSDSLVALQEALQAWEEVECSHASFEYAGRAADHGVVDGGLGFLGDGFNCLGWCPSCAGTPTLEGDVLAYAMLSTIDGVTMDECDVFMDDSNTWTIDEKAPKRDGLSARAVALHELGHCVGLGHSNDPDSTMFPNYSRGQWGLDVDDIVGLCTLYPIDVGCASHDDCDEGSTCIDGLCLPIPTPPRDPGQPCADPSDCKSGVCVLDPTTDESVCSIPCDLADPSCPEDLACHRFGPCKEAFCVSPAPGVRSLGASCSGDDQCMSGLCDAEHCALPCDPALLDGDCSDGFSCWAAGGECGACREGDAPSEFGEPCGRDDECRSGVCAGLSERICSRQCDEQSDCPDGTRCEGGSCVPEGDGTLGSPCHDNEDCVLSVCAHVGDDGFCSEPCGGGTECPDGFACEEIGGASLCVGEGEAFGGPCETHADCATGLCAVRGHDAFCTRSCASVRCPAGWECLDAGEERVCGPRADEGGCGCRASGRDVDRWGAMFAALALLVVFAVVRRREGPIARS